MKVIRSMLFWHSWRLAVWAGRAKAADSMVRYHNEMAATCAGEIERRILKPVSIEEASAAIERAQGRR